MSPSSFEELRRCVKARSCSLDKNRLGSHVGREGGALRGSGTSTGSG